MTHAQHKVWRFIVEFSKSHSRSPTLREILSGIGGVGVGSVHERVEILIRDGHLIRFPYAMGMPACYIPVIRIPREASV